MNILAVDPRTDPLWYTFVSRYTSDLFHSPKWVRVVTDTYGFAAQALVVLDDADEPKAGIIYCKIEDMFGPRIVSLPFSDFCDPLVYDTSEWTCLIEWVFAEACPITLRCLHNNIPLHDERLTLVNRAKWHGVDLAPDSTAIWNNLSSSARRAIRKAQRTGVTVRSAQRKEELRAFFELHLRVRKYKYRLVAQPYSFFENIWDQFIDQQQGVLLLAVYEDDIIGGVLFLVWQNKLYYKFNASDPDRTQYRPNDLIVWEGIQYGQSKGYTQLDFGLSDWDQEGLLQYKRKFATEEKTISFLRYTPNGSHSPNAQHLRTLLPRLTDLFTDASVPDSVTEQAGALLYRYFT